MIDASAGPQSRDGRRGGTRAAASPADIDAASPSWCRCARSADAHRATRRSQLPLTPIPADHDGAERHQPVQPGCTYCYEYGEDKIVDTENGKQPKFMSEETARESVEFLLRESGDNRSRTSRSSAARR